MDGTEGPHGYERERALRDASLTWLWAETSGRIPSLPHWIDPSSHEFARAVEESRKSDEWLNVEREARPAAEHYAATGVLTLDWENEWVERILERVHELVGRPSPVVWVPAYYYTDEETGEDAVADAPSIELTRAAAEAAAASLRQAQARPRPPQPMSPPSAPTNHPATQGALKALGVVALIAVALWVLSTSSQNAPDGACDTNYITGELVGDC